MHPTGRLVHQVPCEFEFETATYLSEGMHTGTLAVSAVAAKHARVTTIHAIDATDGKKTTTT